MSNVMIRIEGKHLNLPLLLRCTFIAAAVEHRRIAACVASPSLPDPRFERGKYCQDYICLYGYDEHGRSTYIVLIDVVHPFKSGQWISRRDWSSLGIAVPGNYADEEPSAAVPGGGYAQTTTGLSTKTRRTPSLRTPHRVGQTMTTAEATKPTRHYRRGVTEAQLKKVTGTLVDPDRVETK